jgi:alkylation response protein AidB-like acyl-CoA dehydrogenase
VLRRLATGDPAVALLTFVHYTIIYAAIEQGSADLQARLFAEVLAGARVGNASSERGSAPGVFATRVSVADDGVWRVSGRKYYTTGAKGADWLSIATLDPDDRVILALVPGDSAGVTVLDDWDSIGFRATESGSVILDAVEVDPANAIAFWRNFDEPSLWVVRDGLLHNAIDVGAARTALTDAAEYVRTVARPSPAAHVERAVDDPHLIGRFGELTARLHAIELLLDRAGRAIDTAAQADPLSGEDVALAFTAVDAAKALGGEIAAEIANEIIAVGGTRSAADQLNLHRHWRNIRTHTVHDPGRWRYHRLGSHVLSGPGVPAT